MPHLTMTKPLISKRSIPTRPGLPLILSCLGLGLILFLSGCSSVSSMIGGRYRYDYAQNFEHMTKYNFSPIIEQLEANPDFRFIRDAGATLAIENGMAVKKIRKERNAEPDFWLNYYFTGEQTITVGQLNKLFSYNLGLAWNDKYGSGQGIADTSHSFSRRSLIIDLVSRENNRLIWRGSTPTGIAFDDTEKQKETSLRKAVAVILAPFPPENNFKSLKQAVPD